jgi:hypothetical protein
MAHGYLNGWLLDYFFLYLQVLDQKLAALVQMWYQKATPPDLK